MAVRRPEALMYPMEHHAKEISEITYFLGFLIATRLQPRGWELHQKLTGPNSWYLSKDGKEFHFRGISLGKGNMYDAIQVRDSYHKGKVVTVLSTRLNVLRFVESVEKLG